MSDLVLIVGGRRYAGWTSIRVTRSIENLAGSFALEVSDRWGGQDQPWPIAEEDACRVEIDGTVVIDGYIDKRSQSLAAGQRSLSYSGRDRAAALVDCSAVLDTWTFRNVPLDELATKLAAPFRCQVTVQPGLVLTKKPSVIVHPGDSPYEALKREAAVEGVLLVSDGAGGVVITRAGSGRVTTPLMEGENVLAASVEYDGADRFRRYAIATQIGGTDEAAGEHTRIQAEATDEGVRRADRVILIRPEKGLGVADARKRADWEARHRAARAETVTVNVLGWTTRTGAPWPLNALVFVAIPAIGVRGDLLISQAEHSVGNDGAVTQLHLVRPDAFTPEPKAKVGPTGAWKELAGGAL